METIYVFQITSNEDHNLNRTLSVRVHKHVNGGSTWDCTECGYKFEIINFELSTTTPKSSDMTYTTPKPVINLFNAHLIPF